MTRALLAVAMAGLSGLGTSCQFVQSGEDASGKADTPSALLQMKASSSKARAVEDYNRSVSTAASSGEEWPRDALLVARRFSSWHSERVSAWQMEGKGERPSLYHIVGIADGFLDDSVRGERLELVLERGADEVWQVTSAEASIRCWPERGHTGYGSEPCR